MVCFSSLRTSNHHAPTITPPTDKATVEQDSNRHKTLKMDQNEDEMWEAARHLEAVNGGRKSWVQAVMDICKRWNEDKVASEAEHARNMQDLRVRLQEAKAERDVSGVEGLDLVVFVVQRLLVRI